MPDADRRFSVVGGTVAGGSSTAFQSSSALIRGPDGKSKGYAIGDELPDGSLVNDIRQGRGGVDVEVVRPDGSITVLGRPGARVSARRYIDIEDALAPRFMAPVGEPPQLSTTIGNLLRGAGGG